MSNAELIERLNKPCGRTTGHGESCSVGWLCRACADKAKAADALAASDKRIAELEELLDERHEDYRRERDRLNEENSAVLECLKEAERKLSVAREVLKTIRWTPQMGELWKIAEEALAQIGGEE